ncbi:NADP-dependent phosphogluconate dehydrogenase [Candidatus Woesearchaeota archaeon]|nr:NADP-dependent phosphogluconate dehydrogenase [Candidatus Woesearchaeota archaeon]
MPKQKIAMIGLGPMGLNLALNIKDHGFDIIGYNRGEEKRVKARKEGLKVADSLDEVRDFFGNEKRIFWMMVEADAIDAVLEQAATYLRKGDVIIEGGNSYFKDTERRVRWAEEKGLTYIGTGVSGGEAGARYGPSIMPGGTKEAYHEVAPILEAIAAKAPQDKKPCVSYNGPGGAGHFVKMVHNGIEYGIMAMIGEIVWLLKESLDLDFKDIGKVMERWNKKNDVLSSYLIEITADGLQQKDSKSKGFLVERIADLTRMKGTGMWTANTANELLVPIPTIYSAITSRLQSAEKTLRMEIGNKVSTKKIKTEIGIKDKDKFIAQAHNALYAANLSSYSQGLNLIKAGSEKWDYGINLSNVAKDWRAGCIIRAPTLLYAISEAYKNKKKQPENLILHAPFIRILGKGLEDLAEVTSTARKASVPVPVLDAAYNYLKQLSSNVLVSASVMALQRDYFGAHQYFRIDKNGALVMNSKKQIREFHTEWMKKGRQEVEVTK